MLATSKFKHSRWSWFRCPHCDFESYRSTCRTILSKRPPRVTVEYKCNSCGKLSTLRHPALISVGLPFAISVLAFLMLYNALTNGVPWFLSIAIVGGTVAVLWVAELGISRLLKRFIRA